MLRGHEEQREPTDRSGADWGDCAGISDLLHDILTPIVDDLSIGVKNNSVVANLFEGNDLGADRHYLI